MEGYGNLQAAEEIHVNVLVEELITAFVGDIYRSRLPLWLTGIMALLRFLSTMGR
jgi:hypothetical protein